MSGTKTNKSMMKLSTKPKPDSKSIRERISQNRSERRSVLGQTSTNTTSDTQMEMEKSRRYKGTQLNGFNQVNNILNDPFIRAPQNNNQNYYQNNISPEHVNANGFENMSEFAMDEGSNTMDEIYYDNQELGRDESYDIPEGLVTPKESLTIGNAIEMHQYNDADEFESIRNDATTVVNKTMIVSTFLFNFADDIFMKVLRQVDYTQCNQSVFNYPVSDKRENFAISKVEANIKENPRRLQKQSR